MATAIGASLAIIMGVGAGSASALVYVPDGSLTGTNVNHPFGIAFDGSTMYVSNYRGSTGGNGNIGGLDLSTTPPGDLAPRGLADFRGVAVDPTTHNVYGSAVDGEWKIFTFDSSGAQVGEPFEPGGFALGLASNASGNVFAGMAGAVREFAPDGQLVQTLECTGCPGGDLAYASSLAFDGAGDLYVADPFMGRIVKFEEEGDPTTFGSPTEFVTGASPQGVAYDPTTDTILAGMGCGAGFKVVVFDRDGGEVGEFGTGPEYHCSSSFGDNPIGVDPATGTAYISNAADPEENEATLYRYQPLPEPEATTGSATEVTQAGATLTAVVNPKGQSTVECKFEYGATNAYGNSAPCTPDPGSANADTSVEAQVSGLDPLTTVHYRVVITTAAGGAAGTDETFVSLPNAPTVTTGGVSGITQTSSTVSGTVNPAGVPVTACVFEYGPTAAYGVTVPCSPSPGAVNAVVGVSAALSGLAVATTYHFRLVATNAGGDAMSADGTFTTLADTCATNAALCPPPVLLNPKPVKCKKGFKKKKVKGKYKCVKRHMKCKKRFRKKKIKGKFKCVKKRKMHGKHRKYRSHQRRR